MMFVGIGLVNINTPNTLVQYMAGNGHSKVLEVFMKTLYIFHNQSIPKYIDDFVLSIQLYAFFEVILEFS
jgi:hypothetical protein